MSGLVKVLQGIEFELKALREEGSDFKALMSRDDSFANLKLRGYERHLYAREYFALLIASLEGKLPSDKQLAINDMNKGRGEWFHDVVFTDDKTITFYEGVPKIANEPSQLEYTAKKTFELNGLMPANYYSVIQVFNANPKLGKHIWTTTYKKLSEFIKTKTGLILPEKNTVWPVGRCGYGCDVYAYYVNRASRGVVVGKKNSVKTDIVGNTAKDSSDTEMHKIFQAVQEGKNFEYKGHIYSCKDK